MFLLTWRKTTLEFWTNHLKEHFFTGRLVMINTMNLPQMIIRIANEFSETPEPRSRDEGDYSGQQFLEEILNLNLKKRKKLSKN